MNNRVRFSYEPGFVKFMTLLLVMMPALAHAHVFTGEHSGFAHPFQGWDHIIAMVAAGIWIAQLGGRARFFIPISFLGVGALGFMLGGAVSMSLALIEQGIILSVLLLGILIVSSARFTLPINSAVAGVFALLHGYSHGVSLVHSGSPLMIGVGLLIASALIISCGICIGFLLNITSTFCLCRKISLIRATGIVIATTGLAFWIYS